MWWKQFLSWKRFLKWLEGIGASIVGVHPPRSDVSFETIEAVSIDGLVMVELEYIGEGHSGDYTPEDEGDEPLLRFTLFRRWDSKLDQDKFAQVCEGDDYEEGDWAQVRDGSYCTRISANYPRHLQIEAAQYLLRQVEDDLRDLVRKKRHYEELSWMQLDKHGVTFAKL